ncbi:MAG TPA: hypothetical protein PLY21_15230 [Spirochaetota bacterium]|nr:hypothetical protein [Spirochaetota bacterium]
MAVKTNSVFFFLIIPFLLFSHSEGEGKVMEENKCIKRYQVTRDKNPWSGFTSSYKEEEESKKINSVSLKTSEYKPIPGLEKYTKGKVFIIGRSDKLHRIAVESSLFSELNRGDATKKSEEKFFVGQYRDLSFKFFKAQELAEFLIESQIVNTYWHVEADFCLIEEADTPQSYTARYQGKHVYYTNRENEDPLNFDIIIEKKTGKIFLDVK